MLYWFCPGGMHGQFDLSANVVRTTNRAEAGGWSQFPRRWLTHSLPPREENCPMHTCVTLGYLSPLAKSNVKVKIHSFLWAQEVLTMLCRTPLLKCQCNLCTRKGWSPCPEQRHCLAVRSLGGAQVKSWIQIPPLPLPKEERIGLNVQEFQDLVQDTRNILFFSHSEGTITTK